MNSKFGAIDFPEYPAKLLAFMGVAKNQAKAIKIPQKEGA